MSVDSARLEQFVEKAVVDLSATYSAASAYVGDRLGLFREMAGAGPLTADQLAQRTGTNPRYVAEWLATQAAGGFIDYHPDNETFELNEEQAMVLADEDSPVYLAGLFEITAALWASADRITEAFRTGEGVGWHEHDPSLYRGVERLFAPLYKNNLAQEWIPALEGVEDKLTAGAKVADIGCGHGASTIVMAQAFPESRFVGYDYHRESIEAARKAAAEAGINDRIDFEVQDSQTYSADDFDLICFFDCLHDMGDPVGAAAHARSALADDGTLLVVEPQAGNHLEDNLNPVSRIYYGGSVFLCTPSSMSQEVGAALGAQAGEERLREVFTEAGFGQFRKATETPFNMVLEVKNG